ncbi:thiol-disulfide oxidoreductase DCC family protein [Kaistella jeonii]|uniref:Thiol-disulfide oxidoreductase n=1 Tax=Kaistella jeonii TaxID=266749 RepID=A0A0C1CUU4_9FLAO|nr:DCC1-like thiol-disulfide oxidoreductase family protein [Kaistella jeonii]KIA88051.1 thiol-disulfide oxidoreductase [Kaistella jeonii]SFC31315.1 Predicted thiol-disulfide oxidoreductase YuxK, DCC family [Kaistella jeonii]VEI95596.1 Protein of uncharacterised function, DUF393 [Kaistella jeonii]
MIDSTKYYVFYDGDCGFCNYWVQWILKNDVKDQFLFSSLQSDFGQKFLTERGLENKEFSTLYLWKPNSFYLKKSQAALKIARIMGGKFAIIGNLNFFPSFLSDLVYNQIAKNRTKLASQKCFLPNGKERAKFVE